MREMRAAELMTPDPLVVETTMPIDRVARALREHDIGSVPVVSDRQSGRLVGVITDRDIAIRCTAGGHDPRECTAEHHMTREVRTARADDEIEEVQELMRADQVRRIPVLDSSQRVIGIIAQADLAVDAVRENATHPLDIAYTLERISKPARPERRPSH